MTDRHKGYIITLRDDIRDEDAEKIMTAIIMISGVIGVQPLIAEPMDIIAENRARRKLTDQMFDILFPNQKKE